MHLFLKQFPKILKSFPKLKWYIIGDGDQKVELETQVSKLNLKDSVFFLGKIYDENELAPWFLSAKVLIHPAAIGLSILHSFGYGLPILTHNQARYHGPEFCALENNVNSITYQKDNYEDCVIKLLDLLNGENNLKLLGLNARKIVNEKYNVDIMSKRFIEIVNYKC